MPRKSANSGARFPEAFADQPDKDLPEITDEALARVDLRIGDRLIRRGRPPLGAVSKSAVRLRLDTDVIAHFKAGGPGWQLRETLRKPSPRRTRNSG